jgi:plastocyanin
VISTPGQEAVGRTSQLDATVVDLGRGRRQGVGLAAKLGSVLFAVALVTTALALRGPSEAPAAASGRLITMGHESFGRSVITIHAGQRLTFANSSHWLHVLVPGRGARQDSQNGLPQLGGRNAHLSQHGDRWVTSAWNTPGTYFITCQLHPEMTLEVRVLPRRSSKQSGNAVDLGT